MYAWLGLVYIKLNLCHWFWFCKGELDMANPRHVFRAEGNAWLQQLEDQIVLGPSHVFEYIKTDGYKRLVDEERFTSFFTIFTSIKQSILHDYDGDTTDLEGTHDYVDVLHYGGVFTHS